MNSFKYLVLSGALALLSLTTVSAAYLTPTESITGQGSIIFSGSVYVDNDGAGDGTNSELRGIANITMIRNSAGDDLWNDSNSELNLVFEGFTRDQLTEYDIGLFAFNTTAGFVNFYENSPNVFQATGDFDVDSALIESGTNVLLANAQVDPNVGRAAHGTFGGGAYSSNGILSVTSGLWFDMLNTNSIRNGLADMTFNMSADDTSTAGYDFSGSGNLATNTIASVSEPITVGLLGLGLIGLGFVRKVW